MWVESLTPRIGAVIHDVDLRADLDQALFSQIESAFHQHEVIFFRGQDLAPLELLSIAKRFGELDKPHPLLPQRPEDPRVALVLNNQDRPPNNDEWHSDVTFAPEPPLGSLLQAIELPPSGGDTLWSSMTALFDDLPADLKERLQGMEAWHSIEAFAGGIHDSADGERVRQALRDNPPVKHPVVRTHPVTGKSSIYVNEIFTQSIEGLSPGESDDILHDLFARVRKPDYQVRFRWTEGAIAVWDNRNTQHYAVADYYPLTRVMHRVTIRGDKPYFDAQKPNP